MIEYWPMFCDRHLRSLRRHIPRWTSQTQKYHDRIIVSICTRSCVISLFIICFGLKIDLQLKGKFFVKLRDALFGLDGVEQFKPAIFRRVTNCWFANVQSVQEAWIVQESTLPQCEVSLSSKFIKACRFEQRSSTTIPRIVPTDIFGRVVLGRNADWGVIANWVRKDNCLCLAYFEDP